MAMRIPGLGALNGAADRIARVRLATLESRLVKLEGEGANAREAAIEKVRAGGILTRAEVAAFLSVSKKKVQRLDDNGKGPLPRCPGLGSVVRYSSRDVLRLASANRKER